MKAIDPVYINMFFLPPGAQPGVFHYFKNDAAIYQEGFKRHIEKKEDFQIGFGGKLIRICLLSLLSSLKVELFCIKSWFTIF